MKFYWSDREGNAAPSNCLFKIRPFCAPLQEVDTQRAILPPPSSEKVIKKTFLPSKEEWIQKVENALNRIHRNELQKVVLARACILELETAPDPFAITASLKQRAQGAFVYCFQNEKGAFLGATPERLFLRQGRTLHSEAVAGTRRRGKTKIEDEQLGEELLQSVKDLSEFAFIPEYLEKTLSPFCLAPLSFSPISIHKTQTVQHLYRSCSGLLKQNVTDEQILEQIHPTPALCGFPKKIALSSIRELEPFERGLYGGAIGWTTGETSEWIVAIRSCLLQGKTATLYTGTGIVKGSDPEREWDELNQKQKLYEAIFF